MSIKYPRFLEALMSLGKDDDERAAVIGVSRRQILKYKHNNALPRAEIIKRHPILDDALTHDFRGELTYTSSS